MKQDIEQKLKIVMEKLGLEYQQEGDTPLLSSENNLIKQIYRVTLERTELINLNNKRPQRLKGNQVSQTIYFYKVIKRTLKMN